MPLSTTGIPTARLALWWVALLAVSLAGPMAGMLWLTLVSAFGIAAVKALVVTAYFMHLDRERR